MKILFKIILSVSLIGTVITVGLGVYSINQNNSLGFHDSELNEMGDPILKTAASNYPENEREKFCGSGNAKSNSYVKEYKIPSACTQPLAITTDPDGNVWFAQSNTGKLSKFDPILEKFTEFDNPYWPRGENSMMWGIDYSSSGSLLFTDERFDSVWLFDIENVNYTRFQLPSEGNSLLQKIQISGSRVFVNDLTGDKMIMFDLGQDPNEFAVFSLPSQTKDGLTGDFAFDSNNNLWYSNWKPGNFTDPFDGQTKPYGGVFIKVNATSINSIFSDEEPRVLIDVINLSSDLVTPSGLTFDNNDNAWLLDSSRSSLFRFNPVDQTFVKYPTSHPSFTFENSTGSIEEAYSKPYWIEKDHQGNLVFNEQGSNKIGLLNPNSDYLIEYVVPSVNPYWGNCKEDETCGLSQIFDFAVAEDKIWFTEWVENNIGYVDTSLDIPINLQLNSTNVSLMPGDSSTIEFTISTSSEDISLIPIMSNPNQKSGLEVQLNVDTKPLLVDSSNPLKIKAIVNTGKASPPGEYKILLGSALEDMSISKYFTVNIQEP